MEAAGAAFHMGRMECFKGAKDKGEEKALLELIRPFLIKIGTAFAMWIWSIYVRHTASCTNDCKTLEHYTSDQNPYKVAETIHSCWRSLSSCNSRLAHRVLMAATAQPRRLAEHTSTTAASPQLNTSCWDISLTTSSMQRCEMSQFLPRFLFMIMVCGGAIIDTEREKHIGLGMSPGLSSWKTREQENQ